MLVGVNSSGAAMNDLCNRLKAAIETRLAIAEAATPGPWFAMTEHPQGVSSQAVAEGRVEATAPDDEIWMINTTLSNRRQADARFLAANSPDIIKRQCLADLRRLERHEGLHTCIGILFAHCREMEDLSEIYGVD